MTLEELNLNRFGFKAAQSVATKDSEVASYSVNSTIASNFYQSSNFDTKEARQVVTGTVITNCIIMTSGLANRVEISGNDIAFYNDTFLVNGVIQGDTSRLIFGRVDSPNGTFIMEERTSVNSDLDNVLNWYVTAPATGHYNSMFIGRNGDTSNEQRNLGSIHFAVNIKPSQPANVLNGMFEVEVSSDEVFLGRGFVTGDSRIFSPLLTTGFSTAIAAQGGGVVGIGYHTSTTDIALLLYLLNSTTISLGADLIPDANGVYDIGSPAFKIQNLYGNVIACPLPTVSNALEIIKKIPEPTYVGDRGHFGDRLYFDDLTFPEEVLHIGKDGKKDIEHNNMLGFLMKAVIELTKKVEILESKLV